MFLKLKMEISQEIPVPSLRQEIKNVYSLFWFGILT